MSSDEDVPTSVDFRIAEVAQTWTTESELRKPYRVEARARIAAEVHSHGAARAHAHGAEQVHAHGAMRVLELGGGPGLLAQAILARQPADYTLLDFSAPMLAMARQRNPGITCVQRDFLDPAWSAGLGTFDAVVTMQAVHELRHKRRAQLLYTQVHPLLAPGGLFVVSDHEPSETRVRARDLHATADEQHAYLAGADYREVTTVFTIGALYVIAARA